MQHKVQVSMCGQRKFKSVCASTQSDQSLNFTHEETLDTWLPIERPTNTLIRLRRCAACADSEGFERDPNI